VEFVYRVLATAVAVWVATLLPGIDVSRSSRPGEIGIEIGTVIVVALVFGLINTLIKPVVKVAGCLLYAVTFGLIGLVVNGLLFWLAAWVTGQLGLPFHVSGFWAGFFGAIVVSVVGSLLMIPLHIRAAAKHGNRGRR
jgi:putative membrane protein